MRADLVGDDIVRASRFPGAVATSRTARKAVRSGVLWGYVFGLTVASSALGYASTYKTPAQRAHFAALFASNTGLAAINGPAHQIQTVAGYTVWKSFMFLIVLGAVWGLLLSTRLLRGEEDAGRWELLLAGQTTRRRATVQAVVGLGLGLSTLWMVTAVIIVVVGRSSKVHIAAAPLLFFALALSVSAAMFLAAGALTSQLAASRRQAAAYAGTALGVSYALRMVADSGAGLAWLRWATPIGWIEELQPLTSPQPLALLPIVGVTGLLFGLAVQFAGRRDLDSSILPDRASARPRILLLSGATGLAARLARPTVIGWAVGIGSMSLLMGVIAKEGGKALTSSASIEKVVSRWGARGGGATAYLGFTFLTVAVLVAFLAAGQVTAARAEEAEGRLDHLLVRPVSRTSWFAGRCTLGAGVVLVGGVLAAVFAWVGAASQHSGVRLVSVLEAGVNVVPPTICILGIGALALGVWPRSTTTVTYGLLSWSLLIELVGGFFSSNHWLLDTSVFHQMASAPAVSPDWTSAAMLVVVGAAAAGIGAAFFRRRDMVGA